MPDLMWLFIIPILASLLAFAAGVLAKEHQRRLAVLLSLIPLAVLLLKGRDWLGAEVNYLWLPVVSIHFHLAIDSLSLLFLYLTAIIIPISLLAVDSRTLPFSSSFYGIVLLLQALLIGFFTSRDLALFTIFWEAMLLPLYFIIALWGGPRRRTAALKFLIYMIAGSALMVLAVLALYFDSFASGGRGTFDLALLSGIAEQAPYAPWLFAIFLLAFAVKTPMFPFHAWLPDAYYQAPTSGTILLSALLSKAGIYGILRVGMELFPNFIIAWSPLLLGLAITGVLYGGLAAWRENDFKRLVAYSSFSHVNFILVGLFVWSELAHTGAIVQALNHGITITALFLVAGWLEERIGSTTIGTVRGVATVLPHLCWLTLFFAMASVALPGTNNFVGELLIFLGLFGQHPWLTALVGLTVILSVMYMLRWLQKVYFESPQVPQGTWIDLRPKELAIALPLIALILWIGIYPTPLLQQAVPAAEKSVVIAKLDESR